MRAAVVLLTLLGTGLGCRGVLGIDPLPPEIDAGRPRDGGSDVADARAPDAREAGPTYCQKLSPKPTLCADFDESDFKKGWDNDGRKLCPGTVGGGTISADTAHFVSPPRSFRTETPAVVSAGGSVDGVLVKQLPHPVAGSISLDLSVWIDTLDIPAGNGGVVLVDVYYGSTVGAVVLLLDSGGLELGVLHPGPGGVLLPILSPFPTGKWVSVELLLTNAPSDGGPDGLVTAEAGGQSVNASVPASYQTWSGDPVYPLLSVGASAQGPVGVFKANIDDVVIDLYPP